MITLATLPQATAQQVFDQVARHMLTQNARASDGRSCKYREGSLKCAAGCLIGENEYDTKFENSSWSILADRDLVPKQHMDFIRELQRIHDNYHDVHIWPLCLRRLARKHSLGASVVDEFDRA
ncbi:hypothetical protein [Pseudomonas phage Astolliot]|nr:hypothetical protein [Pseudomonas phage Astolliot]